MAPVRGRDPWAIQKSADGTIGISAEDARANLNSTWAQGAPERTYSGVVPQGTDDDTKTPAGLIVTVSNPVSMQLNVSPGQFVVQSDTAGTSYSGSFAGVGTVTVPPSDSANDRIDLVYAYVEDSDAGLGSGKGSFIDVLKGSAGSGAAPALPDAATALATVPVPAGANSITATSDARSFEVSVGGMRPIFNGNGIEDAGYPGQPRAVDFGDGTFSIDYYSGHDAKWLPVASRRISWTPRAYSQGGGELTYGSGGSQSGYYVSLIGGLTYIYAIIGFGPGSDGGSGTIYVPLPQGMTVPSHQYCSARLYSASAGQYFGMTNVASEDNNMYPYFAFGPDVSNVGHFRNCDSSRAQGTGVPRASGDYTINGNAFIQMFGMIMTDPS